MDKVIHHLKFLLKGISAGRADPELLNTIQVDCYGSRCPINQLGVISIIDFATLQIQPFDPQISNDIAKALSLSPLNLRVDKNKHLLLVKLPQLSGESRKKLVKHVESLGEQQNIALRQVRQTCKKSLKTAEASEDEKKKLDQQLDQLIKASSHEIMSLIEMKREELLKK